MRYLVLPLTSIALIHTGATGNNYVERNFEEWHTRVLLRGEFLVLLHSMLSTIPIFYLSVFKVYATVRKKGGGVDEDILF